jgi:nucleoid-associated protein YgaU
LHDTLWGIAAARLPAGSGSAATIDRYWRQVYAANRAAVGADPDLIHPGTRLAVPPYRPGGR